LPAEKGKEVTMAVTVNDKIRKLSPAQRKKVEARAEDLVAEEKVLRELRRARKLTQAFRASKSACYPHCVRPSRPWAETCRWSLNSPTARRLSGIAEDDPPLKLAGWKDDFLGKPTPKGTTPLERIPRTIVP